MTTIQNQFINYLLSSKDDSILRDNNITRDYFSNYKDEFMFIVNHLERFHVIPDALTFLATFPNFDVIDVKEPTDYLISELRKDYQSRHLISVFNNIKNLLMDNKCEDAFKLYKDSVDTIPNTESVKCVDILKDTSRYNDYLNRTQDFSKYYISTGFKELDAIIGGWDREEELATIIARTNVGKCLSKGTRVLMADGTTKKVEDIKVGDSVQSLNRINTVLALHNGVSNGYRIIPSVGEPFIVSSNHILTVMKLKKSYNKEKGYCTTNNNFDLIDITVEDWLKLSKRQKHLLKLYRPEVTYVHKDVEIPPYLLGLWLGDGTSSQPSITTMDKEIKDYLYEYANNLGIECHKYLRSSHGKALEYSLVGKNGYFLNLLKKYNLLNNKHIPLDYLINDKQQRLELLAGLIDTDGDINKRHMTFSITQKNRGLIEQIAQLARGLGLKVGKILIKHNKKYNKDYYCISISGNTSIIPVRLSRKMVDVSKKPKQSEYIVTGFKVEPLETVEYYGFMTDGDHRFMLADNTLTHNSQCVIKIALAAVEQGLNVLMYSGEMSARKVGYRFDTFVSHISNGALTHGNESVKYEYKQYIDALPNKYKGSLKILTPDMISGPAGVNALRAAVEKEHPDILIIDQHSLLEDDRKAKNPVERASNISKDLKNLQVMKHIPIITVSQMNRTKNEDDSDRIDATQIAQSDRIGQDSTIIIGLSKDKKDDSVLKLQIVKSRDSENGKILSYVVDFNRGIFNFINEEENDTPKPLCNSDGRQAEDASSCDEDSMSFTGRLF